MSGREEGNPTRRTNVNNLIRRVKKKEVRKQGVSSKAKRAMTQAEFQRMQNILQNHNKNRLIWRYGLYSLTNFQFHLIGQIDDTTQVLIENIQIHNSFPNALKTRLSWTKNVTEERDAPWQIVLGSADPAFDVLTTLGLWLEMHFRWNPNVAGGVKSKNMARAAFTSIFKMEEFAAGGAAPVGLGSHSIRKFAVTRHSRRSGCSKDERSLRGRWKSRRHVADVYEDTELPYPDAKVAELLCIGGACYYLFLEELNTTNTAGDNFAAAGGVGGVVSTIAMMKTSILSNVVPNIQKRMSDAVALVLGSKALLWLIYSSYDNKNHIVPEDFKQEIKMEWNEIIMASVVGVDCDAVGYNPIKKVPVVVTGN